MITLDNIRDYFVTCDAVLFSTAIDKFIESFAIDVLNAADVHTPLEINKPTTIQLSDPDFEAQIEIRCTIWVNTGEELITTSDNGRSLYEPSYDFEGIDLDHVRFYCYNAEFDLSSNDMIRELVIELIDANLYY